MGTQLKLEIANLHVTYKFAISRVKKRRKSYSVVDSVYDLTRKFAWQVITIFEEGEPLIDGEPGDLKFVVRTAKDPKYVRQKNDLWYYQTISLEQALVGFAFQVCLSRLLPCLRDDF